jgi:general secretion pathway protein K
MKLRNAHQRGFAVLIVLWSVALFALLGTSLLAISRQDMQRTRNLLDEAIVEAAANGAVQRAIFSVINDSSRHRSSSGLIHAMALGRAMVTVRVQDEADKVNPNIASVQLLQALLVEVGADPRTAAAVAASIVEWREAWGPAGRLSKVAAHYNAAGREYAPSGALFASFDELGAVLGMTPTLLARLRPHLTLFSDADPRAATRDVVVAGALAAVGRRDAEADEASADVISVTADARGPGKARFTVHAIVQINPASDERRYEFLARERLWNGQP